MDRVFETVVLRGAFPVLDTGRETGVSGTCHGVLGERPPSVSREDMVDGDRERDWRGVEMTKLDSSRP